MIKTGNEIKAGQSLSNSIDGSKIGDVIAVRPYEGTLISVIGEGSQIATFFGGMEMTLPARSFYAVAA